MTGEMSWCESQSGVEYTHTLMEIGQSGDLNLTRNSRSCDGFLILEGFGMGTLFPVLQLVAQAPQSEKYVGMATAMFIFVHSFGQTFGVVVGGVINISERIR